MSQKMQINIVFANVVLMSWRSSGRAREEEERRQVTQRRSNPRVNLLFIILLSLYTFTQLFKIIRRVRN